MNNQVEGAAVILGLKKGQPQAMTIIFNQYYSPLCLFAERLISDKQVAEEIVDESFLKLWMKRKNFDTLQSIKSFLYIVTRHACLNFIKQSARQAAREKQLAYLAENKEEHILNELIRTEVFVQIYSAIEQLPEKCGQVFQLSFLKGMKNQEIAEKLNISVQTVKNQKVKALQLLRIKLLQNEGMIVCLLFPILSNTL